MSTKKRKGEFFALDPAMTDPKRVNDEREKARKLKKSQWWLDQLNRGFCHYCGRKFPADKLTMDHVIPIARGGRSNPGNIVAACRECNRDKKLSTPVDEAFEQMRRERHADTPEGSDD